MKKLLISILIGSVSFGSLLTPISNPLDALDFETRVSVGGVPGYSIVNKFGTNADIDSGTVPEDVCEVGGAYTGWATAAETVQVLSSSANDASAGTGARTVRMTGLDSSYAQISETVTLNGTSGVTTTNSFLRVHTATVLTAGSGGVNAGDITFRQSTTTANIFLFMLAGRNQTNCSAYTVPAGKTAYMKHLTSAVGGTANAAINGQIWTRSFGG